MSDAKTLAARLAALAEESPVFKGRERQLVLRPDAIDAVLDEIDTTVLPAELAFRSEAATLHLTVAGRRVMSLTKTEGTLAPADGLVGAQLSMEDGAGLAALAELLTAFCDSAKAIGVTQLPISSDHDGTDSLSVAALRAQLGLEEDDDDDRTAMQRFIARLGEDVPAALRLENDLLVETIGAPQDAAGLKIILSTQYSAFLEGRYKACVSHTDPSLTLFDQVAGPGLGAAIAVFGDESAIFYYRDGGRSHILATWKRLIFRL